MSMHGGTQGRPLVVRAVDPVMEPAVRDVVTAAFGGSTEEYQIIADIREDESAWVEEWSLGAYDGEKLIGHVLFSRASVGGAPAALLAPLAVVPERQRSGVGTELVRAGLVAAAAEGARLALVLGHPDYYPRFGFEPALPHHIEPPYPVEPSEAWMVTDLVGGALAQADGALEMSDVFLDPALWRE